MKAYLYLSTAVAGMVLAGGEAFGQCVTTQDCTVLGYTESSCPDGNGVKCPFGDKWFCGRSDEQCVELACDKLGFKYDCVGTGYEGGEGEVCNGKYTSCKCAKGYKFSKGMCRKLECVSFGGTVMESEGHPSCILSGSRYFISCSSSWPSGYLEQGDKTYSCSTMLYPGANSGSMYQSRVECISNMPYRCSKTTCKECLEWQVKED